LDYMHKFGYVEESNKHPLLEDTFGTIRCRFKIDSHLEPIPINMRIRRMFNQDYQRQIERYQYERRLSKIAMALPYYIIFHISPGTHKNVEGFHVHVTSEPTLRYQRRALGWRPNLTEYNQSEIAYSNEQIITEIFRGLGARIVEIPKIIGESCETPITKKLVELGFKKVADLLQRCLDKIEKGDTDGALTNLRSSIDIFTKDLVTNYVSETELKKSIAQNLKIIEKEKFYSDTVSRSLCKILDSSIYHYLSDKPVHKGEQLNETDSRFLFRLVEDIFNYLIDKIIYRI